MTRAIRYYLPEKAVQRLASRQVDFRSSQSQELLFGTCLISDAAGFTTLAEKMAPQETTILLNRYFEALLEPIDRYKGTVCNIVADAVMSVWSTGLPDSQGQGRKDAVLAALEIIRAIDRFNQAHAPLQLPTRLGLNAGWLTLGNIGGGSHFAYGPVGDIPNTASRIESLNKQSGTRLLASEAAISRLDGLLLRRLGRFRLSGKSDALTIYLRDHRRMRPGR